MLEEAKSINLSLIELGKCINTVAENSAHVPVGDSELMRLLGDSFGGAFASRDILKTQKPSSIYCMLRAQFRTSTLTW
ncbi:hypothetical protein MLD38_010911 [Melastoma candidum]|uniref:Uncharacterized protein n=1 Tax=Melastoma candidum TaxID=119954 RepID=A0ACB9R9P5_9MYRT|nr:hypothetical protein MLD38_010911 [Melastoma candidum]